MTKKGGAAVKKKDRSVFGQTLALNFVIVGVIIVCVLLMSSGMRRTLQKEQEENCREMLESGMKHLTSHLQAARDDIVMFRDSVYRENYKGLRRYDAVNLLRAKSSLNSIVNSNDIINDIEQALNK